MRVAPHIAHAVDFRRVNLVNADEVASLGTFDVVICRNVLIYFRDRTIETVVDHLWRSLNPSGILIVGASESLLRFNVSFSCEEVQSTFFYRRLER
jgi:chemotaxis protein methyltransferase CheR